MREGLHKQRRQCTGSRTEVRMCGRRERKREEEEGTKIEEEQNRAVKEGLP